jgi:hypothetical protein
MLRYRFRSGINPRRFIIDLAEQRIDVPRYELDHASGEYRTRATCASIRRRGPQPW